MTCKKLFLDHLPRCENYPSIPRLLSPTFVCLFGNILDVLHICECEASDYHPDVGDEAVRVNKLSAGLITGGEGQMHAALTLTKHMC